MFINRQLQHKVCVIFLFVLLFGCQSQRADIPARADYTSVTKALERVITREMEDKQFLYQHQLILMKRDQQIRHWKIMLLLTDR